MAKKSSSKKRVVDKRGESYSKGLTDVSGRDGFYRNNINVGRWAYGADILRSNLGKIVGLNLIMLLFFAPIAYFLFVRFSQQYTLAHNAPFSANLGVGYVPFPNLVGLEEAINLDINMYFFLKLPIMGLWLSIGLSGGMYVMRNMCWGEPVNLFKDFWLGIKRNIVPVVISTVLFTVVFASAFIGMSYLDYSGAMAGGKKWYEIVAKILLIVAVVFASLWFMTMLSMSVTYKGNFFKLMRNSALISAVLIPFNIFFAVFALIPFVFLMLGTTFLMLGVLAIALIGISFFMLVWTVYSQWIYDKFINGNATAYVPTEADAAKKKAREAATTSGVSEEAGYETVGAVESFAAVAKPVTDEDVTVCELPAMFTLADIRKVNESKLEMKNDAEEYSKDPDAYMKAHGTVEEEFEIPEEVSGSTEQATEGTVNETLPRPEDDAASTKTKKSGKKSKK